MACLGVLFAITQDQVTKLRSFQDDVSRLRYLQEELEEYYFNNEPEYLAEMDKAWDAIHRCLTNGKLEYKGGSYPLNHVIFGGEMLYSGNDYIISLKTPEQVKDISNAIQSVEESAFKNNYFKISAKEYGPNYGREDCEYTWDWFNDCVPFLNPGRYG